MPPCPAPDTCFVYLLRHGATDNNEASPPRLQGRGLDHSLSEQGRRQARRTAEALADAGLAAVYASPLRRARETAQPIAEACGLAVGIVDEIIEVDIGSWEGRTWEEIERDDAEGYQQFMTDAGTHPYRDGENLSQVVDRTAPALKRLMRENLGRVITVVAHNVVNRAYFTQLLDMPLAKYRSIPQDNCGINLLRYRGEKIKLITINAIGHLNISISSSPDSRRLGAAASCRERD